MTARAVLIALAIASIVACGRREGAACSGEREASCDGDKSALVCIGGQWSKRPCLGPKGCSKEKEGLRCDDALSEPNASCEPEGNNACTVDGKSQLRCERGRYALVGRCRGPKACMAVPGRVVCDNALGVQGDECPYEGTFSCAAGGNLVLVCRSGRLDVATTCVSGRCVIEAGVARCR